MIGAITIDGSLQLLHRLGGGEVGGGPRSNASSFRSLVKTEACMCHLFAKASPYTAALHRTLCLQSCADRHKNPKTQLPRGRRGREIRARDRATRGGGSVHCLCCPRTVGGEFFCAAPSPTVLNLVWNFFPPMIEIVLQRARREVSAQPTCFAHNAAGVLPPAVPISLAGRASTAWLQAAVHALRAHSGSMPGFFPSPSFESTFTISLRRKEEGVRGHACRGRWQAQAAVAGRCALDVGDGVVGLDRHLHAQGHKGVAAAVSARARGGSKHAAPDPRPPGPPAAANTWNAAATPIGGTTRMKACSSSWVYAGTSSIAAISSSVIVAPGYAGADILHRAG